MPEMPVEALIELRDLFANYFISEELESLAFDLGLDYDNVPGNILTLKAKNLAKILWQRGKLEALAKVGPRANPAAPWAEVLSKFGIQVPAAPSAGASLHSTDIGGQITMPIDPVTLSILAPSITTIVAWITPGVQAFSKKVAEALGEVAQDRIMQRFKKKVDDRVQASGAIPSSAEREEIATQELRLAASEQEVIALLNKTKRAATALLREPALFGRLDLEIYWQKYGSDYEAFNDMWQRKGTQIGVAQELVDEATRRRKLPDLLKDMESKLTRG